MTDTFSWMQFAIVLFSAGGIAWAFVECAKVTGLSTLKHRPTEVEDGGDVMTALARKWRWWPVLLLSISLAVGLLVGLLAWIAGSDLGGWAIVIGASAGVLNSMVVAMLGQISDKISDLVLGGLKRRIGSGHERSE